LGGEVTSGPSIDDPVPIAENEWVGWDIKTGSFNIGSQEWEKTPAGLGIGFGGGQSDGAVVGEDDIRGRGRIVGLTVMDIFSDSVLVDRPRSVWQGI
jgi:hypothetical protein